MQHNYTYLRHSCVNVLKKCNKLKNTVSSHPSSTVAPHNSTIYSETVKVLSCGVVWRNGRALWSRTQRLLTRVRSPGRNRMVSRLYNLDTRPLKNGIIIVRRRTQCRVRLLDLRTDDSFPRFLELGRFSAQTRFETLCCEEGH